MKPNTITVINKQTRQIQATGAIIHLNISCDLSGFNFSKQNSILSSAKEMEKLNQIVLDQGQEADCIHVKNVSYHSSKGTFTSSQRADISAKIQLENIDILQGILEGLDQVEKIDVSRIEWTYNHEEEVKEEMVNDGIKESLEVAGTRANSYGHRVCGIFSSHVNSTGQFNQNADYGYEMAGGASFMPRKGKSPSIQFNPQKDMEIFISTDFLVERNS